MTRLWLAAALMLAVSCGPSDRTLRIATTTSVDNSGLLVAILPAFTRETGYEVHVIATGSGQAINLGRRGDVALIVTHEPIGERALFSDGLIRYYRKFMFNRFVIAGPALDPAGVRHAQSAADAMRRIAARGAAFVSRGDESGTHVRERTLWHEAGVRPAAGRLIETGQGMAATLRVASERQAYVLTDEATLGQLSPAITVGALFMGDPSLANTYAVSLLTTARPARSPAAEQLARWLAEGPGQALIAGFTVRGRPAFFPWPAGVDARSPESVPEGAGR